MEKRIEAFGIIGCGPWNVDRGHFLVVGCGKDGKMLFLL
jgi:hypothetical protein